MEFDLDNYQPIPVRYQLRYSILDKIRNGEDPLSDIDGREETKKDVIRTILSSSHPYLVSREGTGKTRLAESLAKLLPRVPKIKGCPYNDDPRWPKEWMCPRCAESEDPIEELGIEFICGKERYSRIQGNEYTNEAKILGLKDIQAIAQGESPTDPKVFMGTGVLRGNRGVVFVDELPAIPTKVQVLFHPILEEGKVVLEEYGWERPIDICFIATGNPEGFSHVNKIPEPLLDRLELIPMDMPKGDVLKEIVSKEKFRIDLNDCTDDKSFEGALFQPDIQLLDVKVATPWWIEDVVRTTVEYTNNCRNIDKGASIRGPIKAVDHTYATVESENKRVANLRDASNGIKLAMRSRIKARPELILGREKAKETFKKIDEIVEDVMWHATKKIGEDIYSLVKFDEEKLKEELNSIFSDEEEIASIASELSKYTEIGRVMDQLKGLASEKVKDMNTFEEELFNNSGSSEEKSIEAYNYSAFEMIVNIGINLDIIREPLVKGKVFVPRRIGYG
ncbi:MAG: AAA family ATPase [Halobacteriota archaeon]|nr:AAA family ATPase [Halobacteriota archaeon]